MGPPYTGRTGHARHISHTNNISHSAETGRRSHAGHSALTCEEARRTARAVLSAHGVVDHDIDAALLVVTELVSNARRHAGGTTAFTVRCLPPRAVVEVADAEPCFPVDRPSPASVPGRFGWQMVKRLAERVDVRAGGPGGTGKTITVVLDARAADEGAAAQPFRAREDAGRR
ncbi:ATP-binding protein [Streptomyces globosus]|jgi:anti-sigma regulatory factor (Ser/Thr protein kinase)|uniref:ATP-binding protein n=2 Tax=Streptomyces TaxID=1883 RepID=UPI0031D18C3A